MQIWISTKQAKELGCTHKAHFMGIIPGFFGVNDNLWVSRSDLLNPLEDLLAWVWANMRLARGEEPDFMFSVGREL